MIIVLLSCLDELFLIFDYSEEFWNVHFEVCFFGCLEGDWFVDAICVVV